MVSTFGAGSVFGVFFAGWSADFLGKYSCLIHYMDRISANTS